MNPEVSQDFPDGYVHSRTEHSITTIEFFHPKGNSLPGRLLDTLRQEIHYAGTHDSKVIILRSGGDGAFCAGASLDELTAISTEEEGKQFFSGFARVINAMRICPKLIIGRIHGKCVGGGVGLAAAVDYAIAVEPVEVRLSELALGIGPFVIGPALERKIGISAFSQLAIDASLWRNSQWAKSKALFAEVHESISNMDESIERLATSLSHYSPEAILELKKVFWQGTDHWNQLLMDRAALSGKLVLSKFTKEAIARFKKK